VPETAGSPSARNRSRARLRKFKAPLCEGVSLEEPILAGVPFGVKRCVVDVGASLPLDRHAEREMWVVTRGHGVLTYQGETSDVQRGDMIAFDPDEFSNTAVEPFELVSIYWK
jgi:mannose-6-phosphate isomerase-like protein (cupin superfamily)